MEAEKICATTAPLPLSTMSLTLFPGGLAEGKALSVVEEESLQVPNALLPSRPPAPTAALHSSVTPQTREDWDPWKPILERLYRDYNLPLRDVVTVMKEQSNLRATPKMYRAQFSRWGWRKYSVQPSERDPVRQAAVIRSARRRAAVLARLTDNFPRYLVPTTMDELSRHKQRLVREVIPFVMSTFEGFNVWASLEPWKISAMLLNGCFGLIEGHTDAHVWLGKVFDILDQHLTMPWQGSLLVSCLTQSYLLWLFRDKCPAVSQFLGMYFGHITVLAEARVGRRHPLTALMMGLRYAYRQTRGEWIAFTEPLIAEIAVASGKPSSLSARANSTGYDYFEGWETLRVWQILKEGPIFMD
ncbi:Clr5 domain-containing protein [Immersiella caudata]|uniref:Clr5 domain-containing protein n=1 Tax=Immersiella caudata TaxID=314043 RepID=A0AA40C0G4_9PEZI|nr:Clr5 domain-containing protein [Immersiella caudata]